MGLDSDVKLEVVQCCWPVAAFVKISGKYQDQDFF